VRSKRIIGILMGLAVMPFLLAPARAQAPFYEGKTITIVIGTASGGSIVAARIYKTFDELRKADRELVGRRSQGANRFQAHSC
jgi:hypothetical protein